jgi:hypothetical protein
MAFDFPANPSVGNVYSIAGITYVWDGVAWNVSTIPVVQQTAERRNRVINGSLQVSQENGDTQSAASASLMYYPADSFYVISNGVSIIAKRDPATALVPYQIYANGAKASLAAGDYVWIGTKIEGLNCKELLWGSAAALPVVLRFDAWCTLAGTYTVSIQNAASDRSFLASFTLPAAKWTTITIPIPGDTTGTWAIFTGVGMSINFVAAVGATYLGVAGWQGSNKLGITGMSNAFATTSGFYVRKVGLYLDPLNTGVAPDWEVPDFSEDLLACQRFWEPIGETTVDLQPLLRVDGGSQQSAYWWFKQQKRVAPTVTFAGTAGTVSLYQARTTFACFMTASGTTFNQVTAGQANARM